VTQLQSTRHTGSDGSEAPMHPLTHRLQGLEAIGIHMSNIPSFPYRLLWEERQLVSANLTRQDGVDFLGLTPKIRIVTETTRYPLEKANQALNDLRAGRFHGAAVLVP